MVLDVEDLLLGAYVNRGRNQCGGVHVDHGGTNVLGQEVSEEVLVMKVQQMDAKLHRMVKDHVPLDGEEDEEWYYSRSNGHYKKMKIHIFFNRWLK